MQNKEQHKTSNVCHKKSASAELSICPKQPISNFATKCNVTHFSRILTMMLQHTFLTKMITDFYGDNKMVIRVYDSYQQWPAIGISHYERKDFRRLHYLWLQKVIHCLLKMQVKKQQKTHLSMNKGEHILGHFTFRLKLFHQGYRFIEALLS